MSTSPVNSPAPWIVMRSSASRDGLAISISPESSTYAQIRPPRLKRTVKFYEAKALDILST